MVCKSLWFCEQMWGASWKTSCAHSDPGIGVTVTSAKKKHFVCVGFWLFHFRVVISINIISKTSSKKELALFCVICFVCLIDWLHYSNGSREAVFVHWPLPGGIGFSQLLSPKRDLTRTVRKVPDTKWTIIIQPTTPNVDGTNFCFSLVPVVFTSSCTDQRGVNVAERFELKKFPWKRLLCYQLQRLLESSSMLQL